MGITVGNAGPIHPYGAPMADNVKSSVSKDVQLLDSAIKIRRGTQDELVTADTKLSESQANVRGARIMKYAYRAVGILLGAAVMVSGPIGLALMGAALGLLALSFIAAAANKNLRLSPAQAMANICGGVLMGVAGAAALGGLMTGLSAAPGLGGIMAKVPLPLFANLASPTVAISTGLGTGVVGAFSSAMDPLADKEREQELEDSTRRYRKAFEANVEAESAVTAQEVYNAVEKLLNQTESSLEQYRTSLPKR